MNPLAAFVAALACASLCACQPASHSGSPHVATSPAAAAAPVAATPPAPARMMKMICRNSQDGRNVECGTPNAVMVGMKPQ